MHVKLNLIVGIVFSKNCTIIEGSLEITMIGSNTTMNEFIVFENLREITGYLLIFQVGSVSTYHNCWRAKYNNFFSARSALSDEFFRSYEWSVEMSSLCPTHWSSFKTLISLFVILGLDTTIRPRFQEVNLPSLTTIRNGGVRITENPHVCFVKTIEWSSFVMGPINDILVEDYTSMTTSTTGLSRKIQNKQKLLIPEDFCDEHCKPTTDLALCHKKDGNVACWSASTCQRGGVQYQSIWSYFFLGLFFSYIFLFQFSTIL